MTKVTCLLNYRRSALNEIGLQDLIYQVKSELLAPNPRERARDPYPLFFIDKIELEISVNISQTNGGGIKLTVLDFVEASSARSIERERGHVVKISLSPLEPREKILAEILKDAKTRQIVEQRARTWVKDAADDLMGEPE